jgi:RimJ/RimL family protein N-acetyltransferase
MKLLQGNRICLRPIDTKDLKPLWEVKYHEEEPEWAKWDGPYYSLKKESFDDFCRKLENATSKEPPSRVIMECQGKIIGTVNYYWEHEQTRWLEVGIDIYDSGYWNSGLGTEALTLWITQLFESFEVERIGLTTWSGNVRMMRCAEKLGMKLEGRMRRCRYYQGYYYDSIRYGVLREEWQMK